MVTRSRKNPFFAGHYNTSNLFIFKMFNVWACEPENRFSATILPVTCKLNSSMSLTGNAFCLLPSMLLLPVPLAAVAELPVLTGSVTFQLTCCDRLLARAAGVAAAPLAVAVGPLCAVFAPPEPIYNDHITINICINPLDD